MIYVPFLLHAIARLVSSAGHDHCALAVEAWVTLGLALTRQPARIARPVVVRPRRRSWVSGHWRSRGDPVSRGGPPAISLAGLRAAAIRDNVSIREAELQ